MRLGTMRLFPEAQSTDSLRMEKSVEELPTEREPWKTLEMTLQPRLSTSGLEISRFEDGVSVIEMGHGS